MTKIKQNPNPPIWIVILSLFSLFGGIIASIIGINKIENYYHPYWFGLLFGGLGFAIGIWIAFKLKPIIAVNKRLKKDYFLPIMTFSIGFFGLFMMTGAFLNQNLSKIEKCDNFPVIEKYRQEYHYSQPEINSLVANINGESHRIICSRDYWFKTSIGTNVELCLYRSKLGFGFITLTDDKY